MTLSTEPQTLVKIVSSFTATFLATAPSDGVVHPGPRAAFLCHRKEGQESPIPTKDHGQEDAEFQGVKKDGQDNEFTPSGFPVEIDTR